MSMTLRTTLALGLSLSTSFLAAGVHADDHATQEAVEEFNEATHEAHSEHGEHHVWQSPQFWAALINFILLVVLLTYAAKKPANAFLAKRRQQLEDEIAEAARIKHEAEQKHLEYDKRLKQLDEELQGLKEEMVQAGKHERDRIIQEAEEKASRMRAEAQFIIDQQFKELRKDLTAEAIDAAIKTAEQMMRERVNQDDHRRLAERYLNKLAEQNPRPRGEA